MYFVLCRAMKPFICTAVPIIYGHDGMIVASAYRQLLGH